MVLPDSTSERRLGDYELLHELKTGGMGKVFLGRKRGTGGFEKLVAIKTIRKELSVRADLRTMFLDEAQLLARLQHPAVAQVYDFGEHEDTLFLAMEYVAGLPFTKLIRLSTPPAVTIGLIAEVCRALDAAHELRDLNGHALEVVHRDVSPDNLMLSFDGHVKVLDFGIALIRGRQAPVTEYGTIKGKPPYLSPEQVAGQRIDRRSDIWSVGVVLWEMLAERHLFSGDSLYAIASAIHDQELLPPSSVVGPLPEGLDAVVGKALAREPAARYQRAQDMADDLQEIATSIAAPSTRDYARAALGNEHAQHDEWLRRILGGVEQAKPVGRPTGMITAVAGKPRQANDNERHATVQLADELPTATEATAPKKTRAILLSLALLLSITTGVGAIYYGQHRDAAVSLEMDGGVAMATPADASLTILAPSADAHVAIAMVLDAGGGVSDARRAAHIPRRDTKEATRAAKIDAAVKPKAVESVGTGTLTIAAEPYALVRIDGEQIGATPLFKRSLPAGTHVIELVAPDTGAVRSRRTIELSAGAHKNIIER